ncbi:MAG: hypothetical protein JO020_28335 [Chloroflexi bacterium]|nr:hypothetical protein [Chloroflexota bacterium]MBV9898082.1 hypothetical protein [Chloroflexota bacterium]
MTADPESLRIPLEGGFVMQLRPSELEAVAQGLGEFDASARGNMLTLASAVRALPLNDRAALWELAVRRYARNQTLEQAAGSIGMDVIRARALLEALDKALATVPPPESMSNL